VKETIDSNAAKNEKVNLDLILPRIGVIFKKGDQPNETSQEAR
jgi:hypothetical protein